LKKSIQIIGSLLVVLPLTAHPAICRVSHTESALRLSQSHYYFGETEMILSKNGLRMNNKGRMHFSLVAKSPKWKVTIFRDDDRTYTSQNLNQFLKYGLVSDFVVKNQPRLIGQGYPVTQTSFQGLSLRKVVGDRVVYQSLPLGNLNGTPIESLLYVSYKLPTNNGIPIRYVKTQIASETLSGRTDAGDLKVYLKTKKIDHIMVSNEIFDPPVGYSMCKSVQEVLLSKVSREASGDFDELFEINNPSKRTVSRRP
jgi:hypothetical protein